MQGMGAAMLGIVPYLSVSFSTYDYLKSLLPTDPASQAAWYFPLLKMGCGSLAAAAAQTVAYPLDTVRRTMQVSGAEGYDSAPGRQRGWLTCVRQLMRHGGVAAFYRGCATNCARTVVSCNVRSESELALMCWNFKTDANARL